MSANLFTIKRLLSSQFQVSLDTMTDTVQYVYKKKKVSVKCSYYLQPMLRIIINIEKFNHKDIFQNLSL